MKEDGYAYTYGYMVAAQFDHNKVTDEVHAVALYNYEAYHTAALSLSLVDNTLLRHFVGAEYSIETQSDPIQLVLSTAVAKRERIKRELRSRIEAREQNIKTYLICLTPAISLVANICAIFLINERGKGAKRLQLITGLHPIVFWFTTFVTDFILLLLPIALIYCALFIMDTKSLTDGTNLPYSIIIFTFFAFAILPEKYLASMFISNGDIGMNILILYTLSTGKRFYTVAVNCYNNPTSNLSYFPSYSLLDNAGQELIPPHSASSNLAYLVNLFDFLCCVSLLRQLTSSVF